MKTKLIIGLGNPGREYEKTRHNFGFMAVQHFAESAGVAFKKCRYAQAATAEISQGEDNIILALPQTYMNNSGLAVRDIARYDNIALENILVLCDDLRIDFGRLKLKLGGSDGGHNGLKSITAHLASDAYARLKLGIGVPPLLSPGAQTDFVLGRFNPAEMKDIDGILESALDCCRLWLSGEVGGAMTRHNKRKGNE
ncbi:MAG: aminoacyl-tRNA hydrolase [Candidatus Omnitrophota bacterium]